MQFFFTYASRVLGFARIIQIIQPLTRLCAGQLSVCLSHSLPLSLSLIAGGNEAQTHTSKLIQHRSESCITCRLDPFPLQPQLKLDHAPTHTNA